MIVIIRNVEAEVVVERMFAVVFHNKPFATLRCSTCVVSLRKVCLRSRDDTADNWAAAISTRESIFALGDGIENGQNWVIAVSNHRNVESRGTQDLPVDTVFLNQVSVVIHRGWVVDAKASIAGVNDYVERLVLATAHLACGNCLSDGDHLLNFVPSDICVKANPVLSVFDRNNNAQPESRRDTLGAKMSESDLTDRVQLIRAVAMSYAAWLVQHADRRNTRERLPGITCKYHCVC